LPEGLTTVAILDAGAEFDGTEDSDRAVKWSTIAADMMEQMVRDSATKFGSGLSVAKRRDTQKVLAEQDLKMAGLVEGGAAAQAAKLLDVQALITSKLNVRVEVKKSKKTSFDITHIAAAAGYHWGSGSAGVGAREADQISRNMTVQCKFSMVDAGSGDAYFEYAPKPFRKFDQKTPGPVFGRSSGEADLDPVDMYIGELVEKGTREFVSMFVPCEATYAYHLESGSNDASADGVAAMRAENYDIAMQHFKSALAEHPDDHRSVFCMAVVSEMTGDWESALKYYRQACGMRDVDEEDMAGYLDAKDRVAAHKDRIRKQ
jgi:tetratricopeptide (TPR) repeat protein